MIDCNFDSDLRVKLSPNSHVFDIWLFLKTLWLIPNSLWHSLCARYSPMKLPEISSVFLIRNTWICPYLSALSHFPDFSESQSIHFLIDSLYSVLQPLDPPDSVHSVNLSHSLHILHSDDVPTTSTAPQRLSAHSCAQCIAVTHHSTLWFRAFSWWLSVHHIPSELLPDGVSHNDFDQLSVSNDSHSHCAVNGFSVEHYAPNTGADDRSHGRTDTTASIRDARDQISTVSNEGVQCFGSNGYWTKSRDSNIVNAIRSLRNSPRKTLRTGYGVRGLVNEWNQW